MKKQLIGFTSHRFPNVNMQFSNKALSKMLKEVKFHLNFILIISVRSVWSRPKKRSDNNNIKKTDDTEHKHEESLLWWLLSDL